jgi:hypothetical protein
MTARTDRDFLKVHLLDTQHIQGLVADHPLMSHAFSIRESQLKERMNAIPLGKVESRAVLFFSGAPVIGSMGIDATFASRVIEPFQKMVEADYAFRWHGRNGARGRKIDQQNSRLMLTGLPRGSFGIELKAAPNDDLFSENELADSLAHVTRFVEASARSDEDFASELTETAPRVVQNLRSFLEVIAKNKAGLRLESGDLRCEMSPGEASKAFERVSETNTSEQTIRLEGLLKGVLLASWDFNFTASSSQEEIAGKLSEDLQVDEVIDYNKRFFNEACVATLLKTLVSFRNGRDRVTYQLIKLETKSEQ